jgi:hypothetical protein
LRFGHRKHGAPTDMTLPIFGPKNVNGERTNGPFLGISS